ncbi:MAG: tyrosine-type recombinase/integrase [Nitriliruptorales bacterium]|nr:tyrosine-type recombinase/integrase [Nitriliruptorales bacterium]
MASIQKRPNGRWRARYRDQAGREHARHFDRKADAQRWLDTVTADLLTGRYVDPRAGKVTLGDFADRWIAAQTFDPLSRETVESRIRTHVKPHLGTVELRALRPSTVQAWVRGRQAEVAPSYCRLLLANLSTILGAAVEDGLLASNPCASSSVKAPKPDQRRVIPWTVERVQAVVAGHPDVHRAAPVVGAGCGLRQGEVFGLTLEAVDFLRRTVHVRQQVRLVGGQLVFSPPKGGRDREVPLPDVVSVALAEHLRRSPAVEVTLPWLEPGGKPHTSTLIFTNRDGDALTRAYYAHNAWKPALKAAGVDRNPRNGFHALRHHFASVLLDDGVTIRAVAEYLGHADPGFTLRTYVHLMPDSEDRARAAIDAAHAPADSVRTAEVPE